MALFWINQRGLYHSYSFFKEPFIVVPVFVFRILILSDHVSDIGLSTPAFYRLNTDALLNKHTTEGSGPQHLPSN